MIVPFPKKTSCKLPAKFPGMTRNNIITKSSITVYPVQSTCINSVKVNQEYFNTDFKTLS